ncbi:LysR family transcriptional regulator [Paraglaciecola arctica]|uniref:LysR family transcriptional regulator n=1 Tax=Paraglaciecola arctica TaxID=1128911 RepID=UPI001C07D874|nr:LysR family transcriptional regulator [Paraglaciecola arctica]MBU3006177.1 LysR family transcriptional regulator [Paraglaciecola arctica]
MDNIKLAPLILIFVEVAKRESFTAAAKKLGLSKSAISQQIKRLEEATGQQLLIRNTRGLVLTAVGRSLLARSELLSQQLSLTLTELSSAKAQPSGHFKVCIPPFFEKGVVAPALRQLCLEFPQLTPEVVVSGNWLDLIEHNLDAAIFGGHIKDSNYRALSIGKVSEIFCASRRYIKEQGTLSSIESLPEHKFIATAWQHDELQLFDNNLTYKHLVQVNHSAKVNTLVAALELVLNDMGVALLPEFLVQSHLVDGSIARVLPETRGRAWHFYFLHKYQGEKPIHITRFYELFRYFFAKANA